MGWRDWIGFPGESEIRVFEQMAELHERAADSSQQLATSMAATLELVERLMKRVAVIENILKQQGLAK